MQRAGGTYPATDRNLSALADDPSGDAVHLELSRGGSQVATRTRADTGAMASPRPVGCCASTQNPPSTARVVRPFFSTGARLQPMARDAIEYPAPGHYSSQTVKPHTKAAAAAAERAATIRAARVYLLPQAQRLGRSSGSRPSSANSQRSAASSYSRMVGGWTHCGSAPGECVGGAPYCGGTDASSSTAPPSQPYFATRPADTPGPAGYTPRTTNDGRELLSSADGTAEHVQVHTRTNARLPSASQRSCSPRLQQHHRTISRAEGGSGPSGGHGPAASTQPPLSVLDPCSPRHAHSTTAPRAMIAQSAAGCRAAAAAAPVAAGCRVANLGCASDDIDARADGLRQPSAEAAVAASAVAPTPVHLRLCLAVASDDAGRPASVSTDVEYVAPPVRGEPQPPSALSENPAAAEVACRPATAPSALATSGAALAHDDAFEWTWSPQQLDADGQLATPWQQPTARPQSQPQRWRSHRQPQQRRTKRQAALDALASPRSRLSPRATRPTHEPNILCLDSDDVAKPTSLLEAHHPVSTATRQPPLRSPRPSIRSSGVRQKARRPAFSSSEVRFATPSVGGAPAPAAAPAALSAAESAAQARARALLLSLALRSPVMRSRRGADGGGALGAALSGRPRAPFGGCVGERPELPGADGRFAKDEARHGSFPGPGAHDMPTTIGQSATAWSFGPSASRPSYVGGGPAHLDLNSTVASDLHLIAAQADT